MRKLFTWLLITILLIGNIPTINVSAATVVQSGTCGENLTWTLDDEGTLVISGNGRMDDYSFGEFSPWSFTDVKKACIETGVTSIGACAFYSCQKLENITFPESLTSIDSGAFENCFSLENITIPKEVSYISPTGIFGGCYKLKTIEISEKSKNYCSIDGNLYDKNMSKLLCYAPGKEVVEFRIPDGVITIEARAFYNCKNLKSIIIPESVSEVRGYAFGGCENLETIAIPAKISNIEEHTFSECDNLKNIEVSEENKNYRSVDGVLYNRNMSKLLCYGAGREDVEFRIPNKVEFIEPYSFEGCSNLKSIIIPESVTEICSWAFHNCDNLTNVSMAAGVTSIGSRVFESCDSLENITIPVSVISIGQDAFSSCYSLKNIDVLAGNNHYCSVDGVLYNKNMSKLLRYGPAREAIEFSIPEEVTDIGDAAFIYCKNLKNISIPESVLCIEQYAFYMCSNLETLIIPDGVTSLELHTFNTCDNLETLIIPKSVKNIDMAFSGNNYNKLTIYGAKDSYIEKYASEHNLNFMEHTHIYKMNWESDVDNHWHGCICGERMNETAHTEDAGTITKEPTETEAGVRTYKCSVCGYVTKTEEIAMLPPSHIHAYGTDWKSNVTTHWKECSCGEKKDEAAHTEDAGTITKEPTETETGVRTYKCSVCGYVTKTEEIAMFPPSHIHAYGTDWKSSATTHWKECSCGEKKDEAAHTEDAGSITKEPTETETGVRTYKCSVCGYVIRTEEIEKHGEGFFEKGDETTSEVETPPEAADIPENDRITSITINPAFNMKHKDGNEVELDLSKIKIKAKEIYDEDGLKRAEAALGETLKGNKHYNLLDLTLLYDGKDFSNGYDGLVKVIIPLPKGHRDKTFSCYRLTEKDGKMVKELIPGQQTEDSYIIYLEHFSEYALVAAEPEEPHTHVYSTDWKSDATGHWKECACKDRAEESVHIQDAGTVTKEATETETGIRTYKCSVCGYVIKTEVIAKLQKGTTNKQSSTTTKVTKAQKYKNGIIISKKISFKLTGNSLAVAWNKLPDVDGYDIFAASCDDAFKGITISVKKNNSSAIIRKINGRKIDGKKTYKVKVKAYRLLSNGKKQYIGTSAVMHVTGSLNKTRTNVKKINLKKKAFTLKKGKTAQIHATIIKTDRKKKLLSKTHGPKLSYVSSDRAIATVTATGKIKAKKTGKCTIYVRALNGVSKKIKVTVK